jgi:Amt family ammonium transporter
MTAATFALIALGAVGILAVIPSLHMLEAALGGQALPGSWPALALVSALGLVVGGAGALIIRIPGEFLPQSAALGALFSAIATVPARSSGAGPLRLALIAVVATALVYLPASTLVFFTWFDPFATHLGVVDFGIALPTMVGACSVALGGKLLELRARDSAERRSPRGRPAVLSFLGLWLAVAVWLLSMELAVDAISSIILINVLIMPLASGLAGAVVERVKHVANTGQGLAGAGLAGLAAAVPTAAYLDPLLALITGLVAGAVCTLLPRGGYFVGSRLVLRTILFGALTGLVLLGVFARGSGTVYTGQPEVLFGQVLGSFMVMVMGFAVAAVLWLLGRALHGGTGARKN